MAAPKTVKTVTLDGSTKDFEIPFEYLARKFVVLTLIGTDRKELVLNVDYRFTQRTIVTTTQVWGPGTGYTLLEIKRVTSATERLVDFSDGSILRASDLNTATAQALHIAEEGRDIATDTIGVDNDGNLDARGRRIVNLADAINPGDAVTLKQNQEWAGSALNQADQATQQANISTQQAAASAESARLAGIHNFESKEAATRSDQSRQASENAQINSQNARDKAKLWAEAPSGTQVEPGLYSARAWALTSGDYADQALASKNAAAASQGAAAGSAATAKTEADRAKTVADKLGNANAFMGTLSQVVGNTPYWRDAGQFYGSMYLQRTGATLASIQDAVRWSHIKDGRVLLVDDPRGKVRLISGINGELYPQGNLEANGDVQSNTGNLRTMAVGTTNAHVWFGSNTGIRAVMYVDSNGNMMLAPGHGSSQTTTMTFSKTGTATIRGGVILQDSSYLIKSDGNIQSPIFKGGTLHHWLFHLNSQVEQPRDTTFTLYQGVPWVTGQTIMLAEDVRNFQSFSAQWETPGNLTPLTGLRELSSMPFGTTMYLLAVAGSYYLSRFNDLGDGTYRSLTMVSAGGGAVGLPLIYAYRRTV